MKRKQIIDLITAIILIVLGSIILLFPLLKILNVKYIFMGVLSFYGIMNLLKFILTNEAKDYEGLFTCIVSMVTLILLGLIDTNIPLNLALTLFVWITMMSLVKLKKCEYMENHIGEEFEGVISGVTEWGFFVELPNTVEGLVRVTDLTDDFYEFYEDSYELVGSATNRRYKLGQRVKVIVDSTDKVMRTIDFKLVQEQKTKNI